ncbi:MAG: virulence RhuM family protein [Oscillospiraceae bacterium]|nr:virulence RhuM family protein [Oscillospiraceae bacterium]
MKNEIVLYRPNEVAEHIEVRLDDKTVWLSRQQIADLFGRDLSTIAKHINNIFKEGELDRKVVCANFAHTTQHGAVKGITQTKGLDFYNLDVIISVGYRVKSQQGTHFRIWATNLLREYLLKGYAINTRMDRIEDKFDALNDKVEEMGLQLKTQQLPTQGIFFDNQVFDAYELASKIIRSAKNSIVLIDNYIDDTAITHLTKKLAGVKVLLLTRDISKQLSLDVQKADAQYGGFDVKLFPQCHDRFIIIDNGREVYHIGGSLKDLGKKLFAFSKMNDQTIAQLMNVVSGLL